MLSLVITFSWELAKALIINLYNEPYSYEYFCQASRYNLLVYFDFVAPQFGSAQLSLDPINSPCVRLVWEKPEYPGGVISGYEV